MDLLTPLYTLLGTKGTYSAISDLHNLHITTVTAKLFQTAVSLLAIPWQRFLIVEIFQLHAFRSYR
jgi:hypothetical protein